MTEPQKKKSPGGRWAADGAPEVPAGREGAPVQLDDLDVFVRVIDAASMSAAARILGVPKSTVSRAVSRLEDALRVRLLQRTSRALAPTDAGRSLFAEAQPHVLALRNASDVVSALVEVPRGALKVTAPNDLATVFLADVFTRFVQRFPDVSLEVVLTPRTVDLVAEGFDVAIRAGTLRDSSLVARKVADGESALYAAPSYLARRGTPKAFEELATHDCVVFRPTRAKTRWTLEPARLQGGERGDKVSVDVCGPLGADDFGFIRAAVLAGAGIGLMPVFLGQELVREGRLVRLFPQLASRVGGLYLVHASGRHVPRKIVVFRDFLIEAFRGLPTV